MKKIIASFCLSMSLFGCDQALAMQHALAGGNPGRANQLASEVRVTVGGDYAGFCTVGYEMEDTDLRRAIHNIIAHCYSSRQSKALNLFQKGNFNNALRVALASENTDSIF